MKEHISTNPTLNAFGDSSVSSCSSGGGFYCEANVLVGEYWVTAIAHDSNAAQHVSKSTANARLAQIVKSVAPALQAAGKPASPWVAPASPANGFCTKKNNVVDVRKALASPGLGYDSDPADTGSDVSNIAYTGSSYATCAWYQLGNNPKGQYSYARVDILQGGGWAIPQFVGDPPTDAFVGAYSAITVPGTTGAVVACNSAHCVAVVGIGANAFSISFDDLGTKRNISGITAMVAALTTA